MPSKSTLAVVAAIAYGASVMALPVQYNFDLVERDYETFDARAVAAVATPLAVTSAGVPDPSSVDAAKNGTHHHIHSHLHHHLHAHGLKEDGTPAEESHHLHHLHNGHHHHHHAPANETTTGSTVVPPTPKDDAPKLVRRTYPGSGRRYRQRKSKKPVVQQPQDTSSTPTVNDPNNGNGDGKLNRRDLNSTTASTSTDSKVDSKSTSLKTSGTSSTSSTEHKTEHKESRKDKRRRVHQEKKEKHDKKKADKKAAKELHEHNHRVSEFHKKQAAFAVSEANPHLKGKAYKKALELEEKKLALEHEHKEKHSGSPTTGSGRSLSGSSSGSSSGSGSSGSGTVHSSSVAPTPKATPKTTVVQKS